MTSVTRVHAATRFEGRVVRDRVDIRLGGFSGRRPARDPSVSRSPRLRCRARLAWRSARHNQTRLPSDQSCRKPRSAAVCPNSAREREPIDVGGQEVAEAAILDVFRQPVDLLVVGEHLLFELRSLDEPASPRVLNQRIFFGSPTERIIVQILFLMPEQPALRSSREMSRSQSLTHRPL